MNTRKDFLLAASALTLAPALADAKTASKPSPKPPIYEKLTFTFDRARFERILREPARHKQCFGATMIDGGSVLGGMNNTINAYEDYLREGTGAMHAVGVLYHSTAVTLALDDAVWNELLSPSFKNAGFLKRMGAQTRADIASLALGKGNPFLHPSKADGPFDSSVERLVSRGAHFFVCHNAIMGFSAAVAHAVKSTPRAVHARLMAGIVPGALVVPAGGMAINACQEAQFTYIQSSL